MSPGPAACAPAPAGTRRGTSGPGVLLLLCQCCRRGRQVMGEIKQGKLTIDARVFNVRHVLVLGPEICDRLDEPYLIPCACCDPETDGSRTLAECRDGYLIIRRRHHTWVHFVVVERSHLERLLAASERRA
jgi:hypothetical protein